MLLDNGKQSLNYSAKHLSALFSEHTTLPFYRIFLPMAHRFSMITVIPQFWQVKIQHPTPLLEYMLDFLHCFHDHNYTFNTFKHLLDYQRPHLSHQRLDWITKTFKHRHIILKQVIWKNIKLPRNTKFWHRFPCAISAFPVHFEASVTNTISAHIYKGFFWWGLKLLGRINIENPQKGQLIFFHPSPQLNWRSTWELFFFV